MRKLAAVPFLFLYSCIFFEVPNEVIVEPTFTPIDDVSGDYTIKTTLLDISEIPCGENVNSISDENLKLNFNHLFYKTNCSNSGGWGSYPMVEGPSPHILSTDEAGSVTISLSKPVSTFGLELLPGSFGDYFIIVDFYSKTRLIGSVKKPNAGVYDSPEGLVFAAITNDGFEKIVVQGFSTESGFNMAQFRYTLD